MTELEVRKLVGLETVLKFDCLVDNIADFKTVRPCTCRWRLQALHSICFL